MKKFGLIMVVMVGLLAWAVGSASAALVLMIDDTSTAGVDVVVVDDSDGALGTSTTVGNSNKADSWTGFDGIVGWQGVLNGMVISATGMSKPVIGIPQKAILHLDGITMQGNGQVVIALTDTDYELQNYLAQDMFWHTVGGTVANGGSISFEGGLDYDNQEFGIDTAGDPLNSDSEVTSDLGPYGPGGFAELWGTHIQFPAEAPFSMVNIATITHTQGGVTSFDSEVVVPEPATVIIWSLLGCIGFVASRWWRRRSA